MAPVAYQSGRNTTTIMELTPDPRNPRVITDDAKGKLADSLKLYGDLSGIVINRATGMLIAGHQRVATMSDKREVEKLEAFEEPDAQGTVEVGIIHDGDMKFSYRVVEFEEAKAKAAMMAANNHAGEWDEMMAAGLLREIKEADAELVGMVGFTDEELDTLLQEDDPFDGLDDGDGKEDKDPDRPGLAKHTVFSLGEFRFPVERDVYTQWKEELRQSAGFNEGEILNVILKRLQIPQEGKE